MSRCTAGDTDAAGRARALKLVNLYRFLAALPPVTTSPEYDGQAQACALLMDANGQLSHSPPQSWTCYSALGAQAAGQSNIASTPGVAAVDLYMADPGNPTTIGHRRWILSNSLGPIGLGSTRRYSCMLVIGGSGAAGAPWTAFPPPGEVPLQLFSISYASLDSTGWTLQSDSIPLDAAEVQVSEGGAPLPVSVTQLAGGFGSRYALRFNPQGWSAEAGHTYAVRVTGLSQPIEYDVEVVDCR